MNKPVLSVIIPVYNVSKYLEDNVESLINQTLQNIEFIFVNDGSTDNSLDILKKYSNINSNIKIINQKNSGISVARNNGLKASSGKYICFLDSDDYVEKNYYEKLVNVMESTGADIAVSDLIFFWGENDNRNYIMRGINEKYKHISINRSALLSPLFAWNKVFKREFFDIEFQENTWYEDLEVITYMFARAKKIEHVKDAFVFYRQRENSVMSTKSIRCVEIFGVLEKIYKRFNETELLNVYYDEIEYLFIENLLLYGQFRLMALDNYRDLNIKARKFIKLYFPEYRKNIYVKNLSLKYRLFISFNNRFTCGLFRKVVIK